MKRTILVLALLFSFSARANECTDLLEQSKELGVDAPQVCFEVAPTSELIRDAIDDSAYEIHQLRLELGFETPKTIVASGGAE